jgi:hypothetical protein
MLPGATPRGGASGAARGTACLSDALHAGGSCGGCLASASERIMTRWICEAASCCMALCRSGGCSQLAGGRRGGGWGRCGVAPGLRGHERAAAPPAARLGDQSSMHCRACLLAAMAAAISWEDPGGAGGASSRECGLGLSGKRDGGLCHGGGCCGGSCGCRPPPRPGWGPGMPTGCPASIHKSTVCHTIGFCMGWRAANGASWSVTSRCGFLCVAYAAHNVQSTTEVPRIGWRKNLVENLPELAREHLASRLPSGLSAPRSPLVPNLA